MEKLELKHLAPYLPYGVKVSVNLGLISPQVRIKAIYKDKILCDLGTGIFYFDKIKPLLRPLSQLTQEIEHNGQNFVPLEVIARMIENKDTLIDKSSFDFNVINEAIGYDQVFQLRYKTDYDNYKHFVMLNFHQQEKCFFHTERIIPISCIEKLYEWHFDIHNLIKNNLAIELK